MTAAAQAPWHEAGLVLVRWLQEELGVLTPVAQVVTQLGAEEFVLLGFRCCTGPSTGGSRCASASSCSSGPR